MNMMISQMKNENYIPFKLKLLCEIIYDSQKKEEKI